MTSYAEATGGVAIEDIVATGGVPAPNGHCSSAAGGDLRPPLLVAVPMDGSVFLDAAVSPVQCPFCGAIVRTTLEYANGRLAWLACAGLAMAGLIAGCCLLPFCTRSLRDVRHVCPSCRGVIAIYRRL